MPFGLCNAAGSFQRCVAAIFFDFCEKIVAVFMDDLSVYGTSFDHCLSNLDRVLQRCEEVLSWGIKFLKEVLKLIKPRLMLLKRCRVKGSI